MTGCAQVHVSLATTHFIDVRVEGLRRAGRSPLFLWCPVFERVSLSGLLHGVKINPECSGLTRQLCQNVVAAWRSALQVAYERIDWALDIREARFSSAPTLEALPGDKVRFDPDRHALVRRAALDGVDVTKLPRRIALDWFLRRSPFDEVVLVTSDDPKRRQKDRDDLARLRDLGIAEL